MRAALRDRPDRHGQSRPRGIPTVVGARRTCVTDVDNGTTMIDCHVGAPLKASWETTMTGLRPLCSEPERGARSAHQTSPRFNVGAFSTSPSSLFGKKKLSAQPPLVSPITCRCDVNVTRLRVIAINRVPPRLFLPLQVAELRNAGKMMTQRK